MLPHYFEHFKNPALRWVAIVCWVGARSSEISVFFCHLAKLICSNANVTVVILCCCRKKGEILLLLALNFSWDNSVSASKVESVYTSANESRTCLKSFAMASAKHLLLPAGEHYSTLALPWIVPKYITRWLFMQENKEIFFTIRTKITSVNEYENIFFQPGEVAIASDTSALTAKLMHCTEALGDHDSSLSTSPKHLCTLAYFFFICQASEHIPQRANSLLLPGLLLCWDARLKHQMAQIFLTR